MRLVYFIYRFIDESGSILYIGRTKDLKVRLCQHYKNGHLDPACYELTKRIEYIELSNESEMHVLEIYFINKYKPPYNKRDKKEGDLNMRIDREFEWKLYLENESKVFKKRENITNLIFRQSNLGTEVLFSTDKDNIRRMVSEGELGIHVTEMHVAVMHKIPVDDEDIYPYKKEIKQLKDYRFLSKNGILYGVPLGKINTRNPDIEVCRIYTDGELKYYDKESENTVEMMHLISGVYKNKLILIQGFFSLVGATYLDGTGDLIGYPEGLEEISLDKIIKGIEKRYRTN